MQILENKSFLERLREKTFKLFVDFDYKLFLLFNLHSSFLEVSDLCGLEMLHWRAVKGLLTGVFLTKDLNYADTALYKFAKLPDPLKSKCAQNWHF